MAEFTVVIVLVRQGKKEFSEQVRSIHVQITQIELEITIHV